MPFLWVKVLIFQGSTHQNSVGSLSYITFILYNQYVDMFSIINQHILCRFFALVSALRYIKKYNQEKSFFEFLETD